MPIPIRQLPQPATNTDYSVAHTPDDVLHWFGSLWDPSIIAIDTEDGPDGTWCLTASISPGTAFMVRAQDTEAVSAFHDQIHTLNPLCIIHNALYDIRKLAELDIHPKRIHDTMTMAYLLQDEPLGLKPLAWRYANVKMQSYEDTIAPKRREKALAYLELVAALDWPNPNPVIEVRKGDYHLKQPQNIAKKAAGIVRDVRAGKVTKDGPVDPYKRWYKRDLEDERRVVEDTLGLMEDAYLCDVPLDEAVGYACADADMTLRIYPHLLKRLQDLNMDHIIDVETGVSKFVSRMIQFGIPCDRPAFEQLSMELTKEAESLDRQIRSLTGFTGQLSSHPQVSSLLYDRDKLNLSRHLPNKLGKKAGKTKTGDDILAQIEHHHSAIPLIRKWRKLEKLNSTYACGIPRHIKADGRVHADFRNTNTDTGRLSCADPNLMAQPKRDKVWAKKMRMPFHALPGCVIVSMDYSQIELRITAEESDEQSMIDAFLNGEDLHIKTASEMFNVSIDEVDELTHRLPAKAINFGIIYGLTKDGLYRNMITIPGCEHWTVDLAQRYIDTYFESRPGIKNYMAETIAMARRYGYVWDWSGRIRRIPGARLQSEYDRAKAERQACNARIQMGAQSIIKCAMGQLEPYYNEWQQMGYWNLSPLIQIHDDLVSMVPEDLVDVLVPVQKHIMESVKTLKAGLRVDVEIGRSWGAMESYVI